VLGGRCGGHDGDDVAALGHAQIDDELRLRPPLGLDELEMAVAREDGAVAHDDGESVVQVEGVATLSRPVDDERLRERPGTPHGYNLCPSRGGARPRGQWHPPRVWLYREAVPRSPLALAALASVAVPGLDVYDVLRSPLADADFDVVIVKDATGQRWMVRAPRRPAAGAALEAEMGVLRALTRAREAGLVEFEVARPAGAATIAGETGGRAIVYSDIQGAPLVLAAVEPGPGLAASIGRTLAQIHELPTTLVEDQGLPAYGAEEYRTRRLAELDAGAQTGLVPPRLADRWEQQLENVAWWRFEPTVVHGDMGEHQLI